LNTPGPSAELKRLATDAVAALKERGFTIATAEATTGGLIGHLITSVPGSSSVFRGGVAPYSNAMKLAIGVPEEVLKRCGAVSREAAEALAESVREWAAADIGLAESGIAGPAGRQSGLFWIAIAKADRTSSERFEFGGDRSGNQRSSAKAALHMLLDCLGTG
jgi:PncC family amidohydrolase